MLKSLASPFRRLFFAAACMLASVFPRLARSAKPDPWAYGIHPPGMDPHEALMALMALMAPLPVPIAERVPEAEAAAQLGRTVVYADIEFQDDDRMGNSVRASTLVHDVPFSAQFAYLPGREEEAIQPLLSFLRAQIHAEFGGGWTVKQRMKTSVGAKPKPASATDGLHLLRAFTPAHELVPTDSFGSDFTRRLTLTAVVTVDVPGDGQSSDAAHAAFAALAETPEIVTGTWPSPMRRGSGSGINAYYSGTYRPFSFVPAVAVHVALNARNEYSDVVMDADEQAEADALSGLLSHQVALYTPSGDYLRDLFL